MILREIEISGYRGFSRQERLSFAIPSGQLGSGLTILVGPNNAGKSSLVETLAFLRAPGRPVELVEGQKNAASNGQIDIRYETDKGRYQLTSRTGASTQWIEIGEENQGGKVLVLSSRRGIESQFQLSDQPREQYVQNGADFGARRQNYYGFAPRLSAIESNKALFQEMLARVLPQPPEWYIEKTDQGHFYLKVTSSASSHNSDGLGQGVLAVLHILDALYDSEPGEIIVIDEPELSLHPAAQRRLARVLAEHAMSRQVVVATHSPYFVGLEYLAAGATIARIYLKGRRVRIGQLGQLSSSRMSALLADRNNPHVFGLDAREVFFLENDVILVEGQEDVVGYRAILEILGKRLNASFFGWGVGGAAKMPIVAAALFDLGIARVVGLLDAGQEGLAASLRDQFPTYKFLTIPASDIRDKEARGGSPFRKGILAASGDIRPEYLGEIRKTMQDAIEYLSSPANLSVGSRP